MTSPNRTRSRSSAIYFGIAALLAMTAATAQVASGTTGIDASGSYASERAACMSGRTQQDQATCLREAQNAQSDKRRGVLDNAGGNYEANAKARCAVLTGEDKVACEARIAGFGSTTGSVAAGGVLREVETVIVPAGSPTTFEPKTDSPVILVPSR